MLYDSSYFPGDKPQFTSPTIAKLLKADADLAVQEVELSDQIQSIQEKRQSLKTVICMFASVDTAATPIATSAQPEAVAAQQVESTSPGQSPVVQDVVSLELNGVNTVLDVPDSKANVRVFGYLAARWVTKLVD